jgi:hypothetical protein
MRKLFLLALICTSMSAFASNHFVCKGEDVTLTFSKSSMIGKPILHVDRNDKTLHFTGEKMIHMSTIERGLFVMATHGSDEIAFIIPKNDKSFKMLVKIISTTEHRSKMVRLTCEGRSVQF